MAPSRPITTARKVSIGLPVHDSSRYLEAAIDCVLRPTFRDFELVISHNGSTDAAAEMCGQYAALDSRVRCIHPERQSRFVFPYFRQFWEYLLAIHRAPLGWGESFRCYFEMLRWLRKNAGRLLSDLKVAAYQVYRPFRVALDAR